MGDINYDEECGLCSRTLFEHNERNECPVQRKQVFTAAAGCGCDTPIMWRGSVSDLATDIEEQLSGEQVERLIIELRTRLLSCLSGFLPSGTPLRTR